MLDNTSLDTKDAYLKSKKYFSDRGINISYFTKKVNELVSVHEYLKREGYNWQTGEKALISYKGLDEITKDNCRKYVKEGEYDCVIFQWNIEDLNHPLLGTEVVTSFTNNIGLYNGTEFIQLAISSYNPDGYFLKISHEQIHALCKTLQKKGVPVVDELDLTIMPDGQKIPFYLNDNPFAVDGNYAQTLANIKPFIDKLYKITDFFKTQEFVSKAIYEKFGENSIWFIDPRLIKLAVFCRTFWGKPITINNWHIGGKSQERGFREPTSTVGASLSQHRFGRAIDITVKGMTPQEVYKSILDNEKAFMEQGLTTLEDIKDTPTWNHLDIRNTGLNKILIVKP